jgi:L-alanine-DL-glutamate epimerase-like enolase superfamily enzyme
MATGKLRALAELKRATRIAIAAGENVGYRFESLRPCLRMTQ